MLRFHLPLGQHSLASTAALSSLCHLPSTSRHGLASSSSWHLAGPGTVMLGPILQRIPAFSGTRSHYPVGQAVPGLSSARGAAPVQ
mmetsp:Transcript_32362/g.93811  ORF Transcript_32362/g.93811 Transcript_32362/m.93811 type:complete len:86 (+) Transcript_32362:77-334(+)